MKKLSNVLIILSSFVLLTGCVNDNAGMKKARVNNANDVDGFNVTTNLEEEKVIHTERQATYLAYDGDYKTIPEADYPDGQKHLSDPNPVNLVWEYTAPSGKTISRYDIVWGKQADLSDGYTIKGTANPSLDVFNSYLGDNYFRIVANYTDGTNDGSKIQKYTVEDVYPRNLRIEGMTNCRDIGGRATVDGGMIKQGLIFRTSGKNQNGSLTDATTEEMINHLKLKNEINLAGDSNSYNLKLEGTTLFEGSRMDTSSTGGYSHISRNAEAVKNFFNFVADENNYPLFYHCKIGTDRTGLCTVLLHGLLGVSYEDIYQDYLFSNFGKIGEQRTIGDGNSHDIRKYMDDFLAYSGEKFQNKVYNILLSLGVAKETLDHIIENLVDKAPTGNDAGQIIATGDALTNNGATRKTRADVRDNPEVYFSLEGDTQYVSYEFEAKKAFTGQIIAYLANPDTAQTDSTNKNKKIADAIAVDFDGDILEQKDQNFYEARLGICKGSSITTRINYWPVILCTAEVAVGNHEIMIKGGIYSMNIAGIYIFDNALAGGVNGFEG